MDAITFELVCEYGETFTFNNGYGNYGVTLAILFGVAFVDDDAPNWLKVLQSCYNFISRDNFNDFAERLFGSNLGQNEFDKVTNGLQKIFPDKDGYKPLLNVLTKHENVFFLYMEPHASNFGDISDKDWRTLCTRVNRVEKLVSPRYRQLFKWAAFFRDDEAYFYKHIPGVLTGNKAPEYCKYDFECNVCYYYW